MVKELSDAPMLDVASYPADNPYPFLKDLRAQTPFVRTPLGITLALRHRHIDALTGPGTRQIETETKMLQGITEGPIFEFTAAAMLFANNEAHRRRRQPIQRTFAFKLMDAMRPKARALAERLITERLGAGPIDFVGEIAAQIPARIIADILGIPESDLPVFMQWVQDTADALGFIEPTRRAKIEESLVAFNAYVSDLLNDRRARPRQDFLTEYVSATAAAGDLSEVEIRTQVVGLILAGSDTTRGSLCMTMHRLLEHPSDWRAFCADPEGLQKAVVDEGLRFDPIVSAIPRIVTEERVLDGYRLAPGAVVGVSLLSALRDEDVYADPERFDISRTDHPRWHPVFGAGAHRCAGEALAKAEMEETLAAIARLAPATTAIGPAPRLAPGAIRQIDRFEVAFAA